MHENFGEREWEKKEEKLEWNFPKDKIFKNAIFWIQKHEHAAMKCVCVCAVRFYPQSCILWLWFYATVNIWIWLLYNRICYGFWVYIGDFSCSSSSSSSDQCVWCVLLCSSGFSDERNAIRTEYIENQFRKSEDGEWEREREIVKNMRKVMVKSA